MCRTAFAKGCLLLVPLLMLTIPTAGWSQGLDDLDDLEDLDQDVVTEKPFEPGIEVDSWDFQVHIGFMNLSQALFGADQIIVKWNAEGTLYGDMKINGNSTFSPQFRVGRNWGRIGWLSSFGLAIGDFQQSIINVTERSISGNPGDIVLNDNDNERGSLVMWYHDHALVFNVMTKGRVIPYLLGGIGAQYWVIDSRYLFSSSSAPTYSFGGGFRIVGDDLLSVVIEIRDYVSTVEHRSSASFREDVIDPENDTQLIDIPMTDLDPATGQGRPFGGFEKVTNHHIWFSIGLSASF